MAIPSLTSEPIAGLNHRGGWGLFFNNIITGPQVGDLEVNQYAAGDPGGSGCTVDVPGAPGHFICEINNTYTWNNTGNGVTMNIVPGPIGNGCGISENNGYWNYNPAFNGTTGIGRGTTPPSGPCTIGVAYWKASTATPTVDPNVIQNGHLYKCLSTNVWTDYYTPYTYPHPLATGNPTPSPTPPPVTGPPIVTTNPATLIASFSARLNGSLNPHGLATTFHFRYGTTTSYGLTTPPQSRSGNTPQNVSANISGLMANRVYHFRIVASNARGTRFGADRTFTTLSPTGLPIVRTDAATNVASHSATLNGLLNPHGLSTSVNFQYGPTTSYGSTTPAQTQNGNTYRNIHANIAGLMANRVYHFRIKATNMAGTRFGGDRTFTTQ